MADIKNLIRYRIFTFFSIILSLGPICISASENPAFSNNSLSSEEQAVLKQVVSYLSQHSLSPLLEGGESDYAHLDFIKDSYDNITHTLGMITQGNKSYIALFSINKTLGEITTNLSYITTDNPISPILFADIAPLAATFLTKDPSDFYVFIERQASPNLPDESKVQKWSFFNQQETAELLVTLTKDGQGGTYFNIERSH